MTDERFVYESDIRGKKNIAHQAIHRKNGSKSKKCTLPHDGLSQKQWKELNGPVQTVNLNAPIAWKDFKALSSQMQETYVMNLIRKYDISQVDFAELVGISGPVVNKYFKGRNIKFGKGKKGRSRKQEDTWIAFVCDIPEDESDAEPENSPGENSGKPLLNGLSLRYTGDICISEVAKQVTELLGDAVHGKLTVIFEKEGC